eukprot:251261_1
MAQTESTQPVHRDGNHGIQHTTHNDVFGRSYAHLYHERRYLDPLEQAIPFFYTTHSLISLILIIIPLIYVAIINPTTSENVTQVTVYYCLYVFFVLGCMIFPSGPFIRPHPVIWRLIFAFSLLYVLVLIILIIVPPMDARLLIAKWIDPSLGKPIVLPLYAEDCSLTYDNFMSKMDRFVFAHLVGWVVKGLLVRHRLMLWISSITWELLELSSYYYIPNFAECWWDQWLLDVLLCNGVGIELGLMLCKYLEHRRYAWCEIFDEKTLLKKSCHFFKLFQPSHWTKVQWEAGHSMKRFCQLLLILSTFQITEMNAFLLKLYLWIPTGHWLNIARLFWMGFITIPSVRQFYFYVTDPNIHRMGSQTTILFLIIGLETVLVYKTAPHDIPKAPFVNKLGWSISTLFFILSSFFVLRRFDDDETKKENIKTE